MSTAQDGILVLSNTTAALFWRSVREGRLDMPQPCTLPYPYQGIGGVRDLMGIDLSPIGLQQTPLGSLALCDERTVIVRDGDAFRQETLYHPSGIALRPGTLSPLDVLTCSRNTGRTGAAIRPHLLGHTLPEGSFCRIADRLYVTAPMPTYVQSCLTDHLLPNIELGMELCGSYALTAPSCPHAGEVAPLFSTAKLEGYIRQLGRTVGIGAAREAMPWLADGLASPRETEVYLLLVLPARLGGFGLPKPQVNVTIPLKGTTAERLTSDRFYVVDLLYLGAKVVVEYDGALDHERSQQKVIHDKERRSVLAALGYTVIVITRFDLQSQVRLHQKAAQIARAIGASLPDDEGAVSHAARNLLIRWLLNPSHDHLPFGYGYH